MDTITAFPALHGGPVTQGHTDLCARVGHAVHTVDGRDSGVCPRCGEVTIPAEPKVTTTDDQGTVWERDRHGRWTRADVLA